MCAQKTATSRIHSSHVQTLMLLVTFPPQSRHQISVLHLLHARMTSGPLSISPDPKQFTRSRSRSLPTSPTRSLSGAEGLIVTDALKREAQGGLIDRPSRREAQSHFDVLKNNQVPPPRHKVTRSHSQPAIGKVCLLFLCCNCI